MDIPQPALPQTIKVSSPAFTDGGQLPDEHTCKGRGSSPAFEWLGVPPDADSLVVVVSDPDAPDGTFLHWLVTGLTPMDGGFEAGRAPADGREWPNSAGRVGWHRPCPPSGTHRYVFAVHALEAPVAGRSPEEVLDELPARTIAWGTLTGLVSH